jgi:hypothetical protein
VKITTLENLLPNSAVETKNVDLFNEAKFVDDQKTSTDAIKKSMFYFGGC